MTPISAKVHDGKIIADVPDDWPADCEVVIEPIPPSISIGMREEDWPMTPEGIDELMKRWKAHEPLEMTPEEETAWERARAEEREWHKKHFFEWADELKRLAE